MPIVSGSNASQDTSQKKLNYFQRNWKTILLGVSLAANGVQYLQNENLKEEFKEEMGINTFRGNFDNNALLEKGAYAQIIKISKDDPGEVNIYIPKDEAGNTEAVFRQIPVKP